MIFEFNGVQLDTEKPVYLYGETVPSIQSCWFPFSLQPSVAKGYRTAHPRSCKQCWISDIKLNSEHIVIDVEVTRKILGHKDEVYRLSSRSGWGTSARDAKKMFQSSGYDDM